MSEGVKAAFSVGRTCLTEERYSPINFCSEINRDLMGEVAITVSHVCDLINRKDVVDGVYKSVSDFIRYIHVRSCVAKR